MTTSTVAAYDQWHEQMGANYTDEDPLQFAWYSSAAEGLAGFLKGDILEVGCGRGEFARWIAGNYPNSGVTAVDFSQAAITIAQQRTAQIRNTPRFMVGDAQDLKLPDNTFDCVVSCECMEHVPNPQAMANEIYRVLKPGGRFCLTTENYLNGMLIAWLHSWITKRPFNSGSGVQPVENFFLFFQVRKLLMNAGLVVDSMRSSHYQWLLLPRVDPARLCTQHINSMAGRTLAKPFGRHFSFFGHKA